MKNLFVSFEDAVAPIATGVSPSVGLIVQDVDQDLALAVNQIINTTGKAVQLIPGPEFKAAMEARIQDEEDTEIEIGDGSPYPMMDPSEGKPMSLFYYKGVPEDVTHGIPVLHVEDGKVKVSHEGRVKELAEALGLLDDDDQIGDHEYR